VEEGEEGHGGGGASAVQESWNGEGVSFGESEVELGKVDHSGGVERGNTRVCEESCVVSLDVEGAGHRFVETCLHFG